MLGARHRVRDHLVVARVRHYRPRGRPRRAAPPAARTDSAEQRQLVRLVHRPRTRPAGRRCSLPPSDVGIASVASHAHHPRLGSGFHGAVATWVRHRERVLRTGVGRRVVVVEVVDQLLDAHAPRAPRPGSPGGAGSSTTPCRHRPRTWTAGSWRRPGTASRGSRRTPPAGRPARGRPVRARERRSELLAAECLGRLGRLGSCRVGSRYRQAGVGVDGGLRDVALGGAARERQHHGQCRRQRHHQWHGQRCVCGGMGPAGSGGHGEASHRVRLIVLGFVGPAFCPLQSICSDARLACCREVTVRLRLPATLMQRPPA